MASGSAPKASSSGGLRSSQEFLLDMHLKVKAHKNTCFGPKVGLIREYF
jgi:hypothetical protein